MTITDIPHEKLRMFQQKIGIDLVEMEKVEPYRSLFVERKYEFAGYFYDTFLQIPETRMILESRRDPGFMKTVWALWFESFFGSRLDETFLTYLWRIGVRHVEVNLDQRFTNLGFSVIRQFCHKIVLSEIARNLAGPVMTTIDKLLDLCILVETSAYVENTVRCDLEVIKDVADRVRNPATVIGGNIKRLLKKTDPASLEHGVYETLMSENKRLESMVTDIKTYMTLFNEDSNPRVVGLKGLIAAVVDLLKEDGKFPQVRLDLEIDPHFGSVKGDPKELECLFYYLLQNSMEAVDLEKPYVKVSSQAEREVPSSVRVEIFNTGSPPAPEEIEKLFSPFYSTKVAGTGFGLPIAKLVVRKHHGNLLMEPVPGEGTKVIITLPGPESSSS
jgi:signal transduction histidine kinase